MTVVPSSKVWTYEDYLLLPDDDGLRYEIIEGELFVNAAPVPRHQRIIANLHLIIGPYVRAKQCGELYFAPVDVILSTLDIVQPDILYITRERLAVMTEKNVEGTPDFVVEVLSDSTRNIDEEKKLKRYREFGVAEYWIIDPKRNRVHVYLRRNGDLQLTRDAGIGDVLASSFFPGLAIPVDEVLADW